MFSVWYMEHPTSPWKQHDDPQPSGYDDACALADALVLLGQAQEARVLDQTGQHRYMVR